MEAVIPGELDISKESVSVVVESVEEVGRELEGWAEHYHHVGQRHLVHSRLWGQRSRGERREEVRDEKEEQRREKRGSER